MLTIEPGPRTLLEGRSKRLASLWRITRRDGRVFRFTVHDRILPYREESYSTFEYTPVQGIDPSSREMPNGLEDVNLEVDGVTGTVISSADLRAGLFRKAVVEEFIVDWRFPWAGAITGYKYTLESVRFNGEDWKGDLSGVGRRLQQRVGGRHARRCLVDLGSAKCGVVLGPFTLTAMTVAIVDTNTPLQVFTFTGGGALTGDEVFTEGEVRWTGGANDGLVSEIQQSLDRTGGTHTVTLYLPTPNPIVVGAEFTIVAGCRKTFTVCVGDFANGINFRGFPTMPGSDKSLQGP